MQRDTIQRWVEPGAGIPLRRRLEVGCGVNLAWCPRKTSSNLIAVKIQTVSSHPPETRVRNVLDNSPGGTTDACTGVGQSRRQSALGKAFVVIRPQSAGSQIELAWKGDTPKRERSRIAVIDVTFEQVLEHRILEPRCSSRRRRPAFEAGDIEAGAQRGNGSRETSGPGNRVALS
jgi:hypothetical protein